MVDPMSILFAVVMTAIGAESPPAAAPDPQLAERCARTQCLVTDFLLRRNNSAGSREAADSAFPGAVDWPEPGDGTPLAPCEWIPSTECYSRVLIIRQKVYRTPGFDGDIGCLVVGGITHAARRYESFGVVYMYVNGQWTPVAVNAYVSLNEYPSWEDLMKDPCPIRQH